MIPALTHDRPFAPPAAATDVTAERLRAAGT